MAGVITQYYEELFSSSNPQNMEAALAGITPVVTQQMNEELIRPITDEEVRATLFEMNPLKAAGLDGFHAFFYQRYWSIVGPDVIHYVRQLWQGEVSLSRVNHTNVTLIPKVRALNSMINF